MAFSTVSGLIDLLSNGGTNQFQLWFTQMTEYGHASKKYVGDWSIDFVQDLLRDILCEDNAWDTREVAATLLESLLTACNEMKSAVFKSRDDSTRM